MMCFGIIADTHWGPDKQTRIGSLAPDIMSKVVNRLNDLDELQFVVDLGDRIGNVDHDHDLEHLRQFSAVIRGINVPYFPILGNHDVYNLTPKQNEQLLGFKVGFRKAKINDVELIFLNAQDPPLDGHGGNIGEIQYEYLSETLLSNSKRPVLVFTHQVLDEQDVSNNIYYNEWDKGSVNYAYVASRKEIRSLFEKSNRVKAVFQGHTHWNRLQHHGGIPYFSQGSLTETGNIPGDEPGKYYSIVRWGTKRLKMEIHGRFPVGFELSPVELGGNVNLDCES